MIQSGLGLVNIFLGLKHTEFQFTVEGLEAKDPLPLLIENLTEGLLPMASYMPTDRALIASHTFPGTYAMLVEGIVATPTNQYTAGLAFSLFT